MADITGYNQGNVADEGKQNWRGDQVAAAPGSQSIYDSSSVPLAELGSRKVVGDRVFRYAKALSGIGAGDVAQGNPLSLLLVTAGAADPAGGKKFTFYFATSNSANLYNEGYIIAQSGTAANLGHMYRIKSQPIVATTSNAELTLYDPLKLVNNVADKWSLFSNPYDRLSECTAGTAAPVGVAPIAVTTGDYFWLQTWGPVAVKNAAVAAAGRPIVPDATGQVTAMVTTDAATKYVMGHSMQVMTASQYGLAFITIAP